MATSKVTRKQVYKALTEAPDALTPVFEGAGLDPVAALEVLNKAYAAVCKVAPRSTGETREFKENKAAAYRFAGKVEPGQLFTSRDVVEASETYIRSQKGTAIVRAGVTAGFFEMHLLTARVGDYRKGTRVYRLLGEEQAPWGDEPAAE